MKMRFASVRMFSAKAIPEPLTISQLRKMGVENYNLTKIIDYENVASPAKFGVKN